ncbi:hypothetical protein Pla100_21670 [Neorhodopirellula pilleata]|uniref:Uncharacterized protein n=1 Tax=Neorhodopirellula pilleata TaxID=2714738 RepID=A0A5C6AHU3_9BACT|nr:hypothetical protein Pla100_21670 [Neorhodopirellula pilleata]
MAWIPAGWLMTSSPGNSPTGLPCCSNLSVTGTTLIPFVMFLDWAVCLVVVGCGSGTDADEILGAGFQRNDLQIGNRLGRRIGLILNRNDQHRSFCRSFSRIDVKAATPQTNEPDAQRRVDLVLIETRSVSEGYLKEN